jgi:pimeloyl-ACP methyl ester carboxylesterase
MTGTRRACAALAAAALLVSACGCSYLEWKREKKELRRELQHDPRNLLLKREYALHDCFGVMGRIAVPADAPGPLLVAAFDHDSPRHERVGSRAAIAETGYFILLPGGDYDLALFADLNRDGFYDTDEVVGRTPPDSPVRVGAAESRDGLFVQAPTVAIDLHKPSTYEVAVHVKLVPRPFVVESVDDPFFDPKLGEIGVYQPSKFLARTQGWIFSIGAPDTSKVQVILVHGINGTPRDFRTLVPSLDPSRYQVWLFYYPSGLGLDQLGIILARAVDRIASERGSPERVALVAHSMGGLVARRALNELCREGKPHYLRVYVSIDTPYGGVESVSGAVKRGTELVPSWVDVAAGSPFLTRLHQTPLPKDLPFHLWFGWGQQSAYGPGFAGDGTITLPSQLDRRAQAEATSMSGWGDTHVGILSDPKALEALANLLDAATTGRP